MSLLSAEWIRSDEGEIRAAHRDGLSSRADDDGVGTSPPLDEASARDATRIFGDVLEPAPGARLSRDDVAGAFAVVCRRNGLRAMAPAAFSRELAKFCMAQRLEIATNNVQPELLGVRVAPVEPVTPEAEKT